MDLDISDLIRRVNADEPGAQDAPAPDAASDPSPSAPDLQVTRQLREAARAMDIPLIDHVIIGREGHVSLRAKGLI